MSEGGENIRIPNFTRKGLTLIETQAVENPMMKGKFFYNMKELLWSDSTTTLGCLICGDQTATRPEMSIHIGKAHFPKKSKKKDKATKKRVYTKRNKDYWNKGGNIEVAHNGRNNPAKSEEQTLKDRELEFWKSQAHKAEAEVRKLRQQLKALLDIK